MTRPVLRPIALAEILPLGVKPAIVVTMSTGQWDGLLAASYEMGFVLLELDDNEEPIKAYQRPVAGEGRAS